MSVVQLLIAGVRHGTGHPGLAVLKILLIYFLDKENLDVEV